MVGDGTCSSRMLIDQDRLGIKGSSTAGHETNETRNDVEVEARALRMMCSKMRDRHDLGPDPLAGRRRRMEKWKLDSPLF
jgi:hypothetical protein